MDPEARENVDPAAAPPADLTRDAPPEGTPQPAREGRLHDKTLTRRRALKYGLVGLAGAAGAGAVLHWLIRGNGEGLGASEVAHIFRGDAPDGKLWELWKKRGWAVEARHYVKIGQSVKCRLCPNECLLRPGDRGRCRTRANKDGTLYSLAYGNPSTFGVDPIEKKPLYHFIPGTRIFSIATPGCGFRCLNCQNWDLSQRKPEELKDPRGEEVRLTPERSQQGLTNEQKWRSSMFPQDVVAVASYARCPSIAYTYSEPTAFYEYMYDTAKAAREKGIKNVWVTCGYIREKPLVELCRYLDAANVDLKSFDDEIYRKLNSGKLQPILDTLKTLHRQGVWFEVTNLVVPTYTDDLDMIRRMCGWLLENVGPDYPLHFSRFHPQHKLRHLPGTPVGVLQEARSIALAAGLRYVYIGNVRDEADSNTTFCPGCKKPVIERDVYSVLAVNMADGKCRSCGTAIAGVWSV